MSKKKAILLSLALASFTSVALYYFAAIAPLKNILDEHKPKATQIAKDFLACIEKQNLNECNAKYLTERAQAVAIKGSMSEGLARTKEILGSRSNLTIEPRSWFVNTRDKPKNVPWVLFVYFHAKYDNDPQAKEKFYFVLENGALKISKYNTNSKLFIKKK